MQVVVAIVAYRVAMSDSIVDSVLKIAGFATGLVLGLYGLGLLVPRASQRVALAAFAVGAVVTSWAAFRTPLNGYWFTLVGSGTIEEDDVARVAQDRRNIRRDEELALAEPDDDRRAVADGDDLVGVVGRDDDEREQAAELEQGAADGRLEAVVPHLALDQVRDHLRVGLGDEAMAVALPGRA